LARWQQLRAYEVNSGNLVTIGNYRKANALRKKQKYRYNRELGSFRYVAPHHFCGRNPYEIALMSDNYR
jgi:hypothetical protein